MIKKIFRTPRFQWLAENKVSDPKLQKLYEELEVAWSNYKMKSYELDVIYGSSTIKNRCKLEHAFRPDSELNLIEPKIKNETNGGTSSTDMPWNN